MYLTFSDPSSKGTTLLFSILFPWGAQPGPAQAKAVLWRMPGHKGPESFPSRFRKL